MIKFFRKIRQKLLSENKFSKYLIYAIGEIILVVIGILIALQINNWNEERKSQAEFNQILLKVHEELVFNLNRTASLTKVYKDKNQNIYKVLNKKVTLEDYKKDNLEFLIWSSPAVNLSTTSAKKLEGFSEQLTIKQDSILSRFSKLYNTFKDDIDYHDQSVTDIVRSLESKIRDNKKWYYILSTDNEIPDEAYNYFLTDTLYLNMVAEYENSALYNHLWTVYSFNLEAKVLYQDVTQYLEMEIDTTIIKDKNELKHYVGHYKSIDKNSKEYVIIIENKKRLTYRFITENNEGETKTYPFYPDTKDEFMLGYRFGRLLRNENNEVTGFTTSLGGRKTKEYIKIGND